MYNLCYIICFAISWCWLIETRFIVMHIACQLNKSSINCKHIAVCCRGYIQVLHIMGVKHVCLWNHRAWWRWEHRRGGTVRYEQHHGHEPAAWATPAGKIAPTRTQERPAWPHACEADYRTFHDLYRARTRLKVHNHEQADLRERGSGQSKVKTGLRHTAEEVIKENNGLLDIQRKGTSKRLVQSN